jgi:S-adenosylmethionine:diacylglycerol 3-amino-3-carboxypropyl transferase
MTRQLHDTRTLRRFRSVNTAMREAVRVHRASNVDPYELLDNESWLGACLIGRRKFDEAERILIAAYDRTKSLRSDAHPEQVAARKRLVERVVQLYVARGEEAGADRWRAMSPRDEPSK